MKCIFCGKDSSKSKSVEHIIPESFGNSTAVLPKGVVCDDCNNYIGRKIESPFLNSNAILMLRQELSLKNKQNKLIRKFDYPSKEETVQQITPDHYFVVSKTSRTEHDVKAAVHRYVEYVNLTDKELLTPSVNISRLLAKMAIEAFIYRCGSSSEVCDYVREDDAYESIRKHVRYDGRKLWNYSSRRIYSRHEVYQGDIEHSINWEFDFLFLSNGEIYFVIAMFGIEYAINLGGPSIDGYKEWLINNNNISPLYLSDEQRKENYMGYAKKMYSPNEIDLPHISGSIK